MITFVTTPLHEVWEKIEEKSSEHWESIRKKDSFPAYFKVDWNYYLDASRDGRVFASTAWDGQDLAGYMVFIINEEPQHVGTFTGYIQTLWADRKHLNCGIKLLKYAINEMFRRGVHRVVNEVEGEKMGLLMQRLGFEPVRVVYQKERRK